MSYMLSTNESVITSHWETYQGYTIRPVPSTVQYYKRWIQNGVREKKSLIFGATPEIRSLFQSYGRPLHVMDQSMLMVNAMGRLTVSGEQIADNETVINCNWLEFNESITGYQLLIADDAINMLEFSQFDSFMKNASLMLEDDGIFICHLLVKPDDDKITKNIDDVYSDWLNGSISSKYDLASSLNFICYDQLRYRMGWQQTISMLGKHSLNRFKPEFDFVEQFKYCNSYFVCPPQALFEDMLSPYFNIYEIFYPHEYDYCQYEPVYVLKKRSTK